MCHSLSPQIHLRFIPLIFVFYLVQQNSSPNTVGPNMAQSSSIDFHSYHPLVVPTNSLAIPQVAFKFFPKYDG